jgi:hypothetical protein
LWSADITDWGPRRIRELRPLQEIDSPCNSPDPFGKLQDGSRFAKTGVIGWEVLLVAALRQPSVRPGTCGLSGVPPVVLPSSLTHKFSSSHIVAVRSGIYGDSSNPAAGRTGASTNCFGNVPVKLFRNATIAAASLSESVLPSCTRAMIRTASGKVFTEPS